MEKIFPVLSDVCVVVFQIALYLNMMILRRNTPLTRGILYTICVAGMGAYLFVCHVLAWPATVASMVCLTLPSLLVFFLLSRYRDARFFLTYCFVDTISLILGYFSRCIGELFGNRTGIEMLPVLIAVLSVTYWIGRPHFRNYRDLLGYEDKSWRTMMVCSFLIYFALIFLAVYPEPLLKRPEYEPVYFVFCVVVLSCYLVCLSSIRKTKLLYEQSELLKREKHWHQMAYEDALTGLQNRMAYMERISEMERTRTDDLSLGVVIFDMDEFKQINDSRGHSIGDRVLKDAAKLLLRIFPSESCTIYRIGGDEFAVLTRGVEEEQLQLWIRALEGTEDRMLSYTISAGYAMVRQEENNAVEQAFVRADQMMYSDKKSRGLSRCMREQTV